MHVLGERGFLFVEGDSQVIYFLYLPVSHVSDKNVTVEQDIYVNVTMFALCAAHCLSVLLLLSVVR